MFNDTVLYLFLLCEINYLSLSLSYPVPLTSLPPSPAVMSSFEADDNDCVSDSW